MTDEAADLSMIGLRQIDLMAEMGSLRSDVVALIAMVQLLEGTVSSLVIEMKAAKALSLNWLAYRRFSAQNFFPGSQWLHFVPRLWGLGIYSEPLSFTAPVQTGRRAAMVHG
jgi:hypothetical protein